jgi:hypothetical protein
VPLPLLLLVQVPLLLLGLVPQLGQEQQLGQVPQMGQVQQLGQVVLGDPVVGQVVAEAPEHQALGQVGQGSQVPRSLGSLGQVGDP